MSYWDDDEDYSGCCCDCAGCSLHVDEKTRWDWRYNSNEAQMALNRLACSMLGHKPLTMLKRWVQCDRCGEHLSGPRPGLLDSMAASVDVMYTRPGCNAVLVGIRDPLLAE